MDNVAALPPKLRQQLFQETAARRGFHMAIAEKDFWVCWVLMKLFDAPELGQHLVFKGGTSLSKVHGLIDRFSEDIDLVLDWRLIGYGPQGEDPWQPLPSNTQLDRFNREFNERAASYLANTLCPQLQRLLNSCPGVEARISVKDPHTIEVKYPASFVLDAIRPEVKLEIGPLASWVPSANYPVTPYAAEEFPKAFNRASCIVKALKAERTFWEKATILHQQAHRTTVMPSGYSRHYYDMYRLAESTITNTAMNDLELLREVVEFKQRFYRSSWARYDLAKPGSFRLLANSRNQSELVQDYAFMQPMFFKAPPAWDVVIERLARLEDEINKL
jgi:predicted nucleotidyltransferase component of viral defense system